MSGRSALPFAQSRKPASDPVRVQGPGLHSLPSALPFRLPGRGTGLESVGAVTQGDELCHLVASGVQAPAWPAGPGACSPLAGGSQWQRASASRWQRAPPCTSEAEGEEEVGPPLPERSWQQFRVGLRKGRGAQSCGVVGHGHTGPWLAGGTVRVVSASHSPSAQGPGWGEQPACQVPSPRHLGGTRRFLLPSPPGRAGGSAALGPDTPLSSPRITGKRWLPTGR